MSLYGASLLVLVASATPADQMHTATGLGARSSNQQILCREAFFLFFFNLKVFIKE